MSSSGKNIIVALGLVTVVFAGYYFFTQESSFLLRSTESNNQLQQMLNRTQQFAEHRRVLDGIELNSTMFRTAEFTSLRDFSPAPSEYRVGRPDPFLPTGPGQPISNQVIAPATQ